jgi:hypothetical protein
MTDKKTKIEFAPGCFDNFDGTQEELDALMVQIQEMFDSGEAHLNAVPLDDLDELFDGLTEEEVAQLIEEVGQDIDIEELISEPDPQIGKRTLH